MAPRTVVTPGNYDGVHLGHRELLRRAQIGAEEEHLEVVALFFDPHPEAVLHPESAPKLLTLPARRHALLLQAGADRVEILDFDASFSSQSPEDFVHGILVERLTAARLVIGPDFRFGRNASGTVATLTALGRQHGFEVEIASPVETLGDRVSSSRVRQRVESGDVTTASILLGRYHEVEGTVVTGDRRGRTIGFPTANLRCDSRLVLPAPGVYAVMATLPAQGPSPQPPEAENELLCGVANLGVRPTFESNAPAELRIEVHLLDVDRDLYGKTLRVAFLEQLRDELKFDGVAMLKAQIARDVASARSIFADANADWLAMLKS